MGGGVRAREFLGRRSTRSSPDRCSASPGSCGSESGRSSFSPAVPRPAATPRSFKVSAGSSERGFPLPSVFVVHGSRGKIAASLQLDVLVDDRPENCLDVAIDSTARAILVWRGGEDKVPGSARQLGIGAVTSIAECLDILEALDRAEDEVGLVDRFKRLLGLKPSRRSPAKPAGSPSSPLQTEPTKTANVR